MELIKTAGVYCHECGFKDVIVLDKNSIWHECNKGNVEHKLPVSDVITLQEKKHASY